MGLVHILPEYIDLSGLDICSLAFGFGILGAYVCGFLFYFTNSNYLLSGKINLTMRRILYFPRGGGYQPVKLCVFRDYI